MIIEADNFIAAKEPTFLDLITIVIVATPHAICLDRPETLRTSRIPSRLQISDQPVIRSPLHKSAHLELTCATCSVETSSWFAMPGARGNHLPIVDTVGVKAGEFPDDRSVLAALDHLAFGIYEEYANL